MNGPRLLVVGAGIVGRSVAYYASAAGAEVHLIDADADPSLTTHASLGVLTHFNGRDDAYGQFYHDAHQLHQHLAAQLMEETGVDVGWRALGGIDVAYDETEMQAVAQICEFNKARGCAAQLVDGGGARELEPLLREEVSGGVYFPGDHRVDPSALAAALLEAAGRQGVLHVSFGTSLERLERSGAGVRAAFAGSASGSIPSGFDCAVVAAGAWTGQLMAASSGEEEIAVRPVRGQHSVYGGGGTLRRVLRYDGHHLIPTAEGIMVAATVEEVGFNLDTTDAAATEFGLILERVLGIRDTPINQRAGLRPKPRKGRPVIAPLEDMPVFVASGHYKNGVLLGPITGQTVAAWILDGKPPRDMSHFAIAR